MKLKLIVLFLLVFSFHFSHSQDSDLTKLVKSIKTSLVTIYNNSGVQVTEDRCLPIFKDGRVVHYDTLNLHTLNDVKSITINLDRWPNVIYYGARGKYGIIQIKTKEEE